MSYGIPVTWTNANGVKRYQPQLVDGERLWNSYDYFRWSSEDEGSPKLYRSPWRAVRVAGRRQRRLNRVFTETGETNAN